MKGAVMIAFIIHLQQTKSIDKEKCHGGVFINYKKYDMHTISATVSFDHEVECYIHKIINS